jgi:hypothetical protein
LLALYFLLTLSIDANPEIKTDVSVVDLLVVLDLVSRTGRDSGLILTMTFPICTLFGDDWARAFTIIKSVPVEKMKYLKIYLIFIQEYLVYTQ